MTLINPFWKRYGYPIFWSVLAVVFCIALGEVLLPIVGAFFLAYLLYPVVEHLQEKGLTHRLAVGVTFFVSLIIILSLLALLVPRLIDFAVAILKDFPKMISGLLVNIENIAHYANFPIHLEVDAVVNEIYRYLSTMSFSTFATLSGVFQKTIFNLLQVAAWFLKLCAFPFFFYFALDRFKATKNEIFSFFPDRFHSYISELSSIVNQVLNGYIRGQFVVCSLMAAFYAMGFYFMGMPYGIIIGVITGFAYLIPYLGIGVASFVGISISVAHFTSFSGLVGILGVYFVGQFLESFILTPRITGNKVGLDPFVTILALIVGTHLMGFLGVLTAIPIAGILKQYYIRIKADYRKSDFFVKE